MIRLSPSKLNLFLECPLCFWLQEKEGVKRPVGVFPSLPGGMDLVLKKYYDNYRNSLPPELNGRVNGRLLADSELIKKFRDWRKFFFEEEDATLYGAMDECLFDEGMYIPLDFKTRGFDLKEDSTGFYQNQLDCYALLLEKNGYEQPGYAYLVYYIPKEVGGNGRVNFKIQVERIGTNTKRAYTIFRSAVELLRGKKPEPNPQCEYCKYRADNGL